MTLVVYEMILSDETLRLPHLIRNQDVELWLDMSLGRFAITLGIAEEAMIHYRVRDFTRFTEQNQFCM